MGVLRPGVRRCENIRERGGGGKKIGIKGATRARASTACQLLLLHAAKIFPFREIK